MKIPKKDVLTLACVAEDVNFILLLLLLLFFYYIYNALYIIYFFRLIYNSFLLPDGLSFN